MSKPRLFLFLLMGAMALAPGCSVHVQTVEESHPGEDKVAVCHKGKTLEIAEPALAAHLKHGDTRGRCP